LLDPKKENNYWGLASVYFSFNDYDEALNQLEKGLAINPNSANILTDKATIYAALYYAKQNPEYLDKAISIFNRSYKIDPLNQNMLFKLSVAYFYKKDCVNALKFHNECKKLRGRPITQDYTDALKKMCDK
jgi:tetratricopeptide (TPR) repeat protein